MLLMPVFWDIISIMKLKITKEQANAYKKRWELINKAEIQELRNATFTQKMQQLQALMASINTIDGWSNILSKDEDMVRKRWNKLRKEYNVSG